MSLSIGQNAGYINGLENSKGFFNVDIKPQQERSSSLRSCSLILIFRSSISGRFP